MKNVCYVYTWPAAGLTSRASPRDVSRDTFTVGWEKKKGRTREAIETRRKTLDGWKINGPVADLFSFQHCERAVHGRSLWRATIFFFFFSFFARSSSHALHECSGHQFFLFFFFFSSTVFLAALLRGDPLPWTVDPGAPLKFLSLAIELHERRNGVKPFRPIEFYRNATFKSERKRERERNVDVQKCTKDLRFVLVSFEEKASSGTYFVHLCSGGSFAAAEMKEKREQTQWTGRTIRDRGGKEENLECAFATVAADYGCYVLRRPLENIPWKPRNYTVERHLMSRATFLSSSLVSSFFFSFFSFLWRLICRTSS